MEAIERIGMDDVLLTAVYVDHKYKFAFDKNNLLKAKATRMAMHMEITMKGLNYKFKLHYTHQMLSLPILKTLNRKIIWSQKKRIKSADSSQLQEKKNHLTASEIKKV